MMSIIGSFATEIYLPSMPAMAKYFAVRLHIIQLSITIYVLGFSLGAFLFGPLSDIFGRRPIAIFCLIVGLLGSLICCIAFDTFSLLIGRFVQGIGLSGVGVIARSITKDISPDQTSMSRLGSIMGVVFATAVACAPIIGGYIEQYAFWRLNFITLFIMALLIALLCWQKLPETNKHKRNISFQHVLSDYVEVLTNKEFILFNLLSTFTLGGIISYQTLSSYLLQIKVGLSPTDFGYTTTIITLSLVIGGVFNSRVVARRGSLAMFALGFKLFIVSGIMYVFCGLFDWINVWLILLPIAAYTVGASLVYPNASAGAMTLFADKAGTAAAIYTFLQMLGATLFSGFISIVNATNQLPLGILFVTIGFIGLRFNKVLDKIVRDKVIIIEKEIKS